MYGNSNQPPDSEVYLPDDELVGEILDRSSLLEGTPYGSSITMEDMDSKDEQAHGPEMDMVEERVVGRGRP